MRASYQHAIAPLLHVMNCKHYMQNNLNICIPESLENSDRLFVCKTHSVQFLTGASIGQIDLEATGEAEPPIWTEPSAVPHKKSLVMKKLVNVVCALDAMWQSRH